MVSILVQCNVYIVYTRQPIAKSKCIQIIECMIRSTHGTGLQTNSIVSFCFYFTIKAECVCVCVYNMREHILAHIRKFHKYIVFVLCFIKTVMIYLVGNDSIYKNFQLKINRRSGSNAGMENLKLKCKYRQPINSFE